MATSLKCGEIFNNRFIANFLETVPWKEFFLIGQYWVTESEKCHLLWFTLYYDKFMCACFVFEYAVFNGACSCYRHEVTVSAEYTL